MLDPQDKEKKSTENRRHPYSAKASTHFRLVQFSPYIRAYWCSFDRLFTIGPMLREHLPH
ncbi:hypothetical protein [Bacillus subtilis]|uniref:hypothetical protein n=1 Tax=Bacillus subtilis TaxID=1423 RepID=UPI0018CDE095|nr:hypothetical protein [Bacillus subtilis]